MENNITLLNIVLAIISILLFVLIIFKEKKMNSRVNYYGKQNEGNIYSSNISVIDRETIIDKLAKLELEILKLKKENSRIVQQYEKNNFLTSKDNVNDNNFKQVLNYNFFKEKNSAIIDMHKQGKPKEEIAKILNKSIREVEMVINIAK